MTDSLNIAFFGSSLVSAYWNGAATYYRGIVKALAARGHRITFFEPDAFDRQAHRDIEDPPWARVVVYAAGSQAQVLEPLEQARHADIVIKASGIGVFDVLLEREMPTLRRPGNRIVFWDVDAPATLERIAMTGNDPFARLASAYDLILTYGGGPHVIDGYAALGAGNCVPIYNAVDPEEHFPVPPDARFRGMLGFVGNRLPDREERVRERVREFFFKAAHQLPDERFLLAGNGWPGDSTIPPNVDAVGHLYSRDHNAFNCTPRAVLNVNRRSMARAGYSPPTRVFEAAGAGACLITDAWEGIEHFLDPGEEILVAHDGDEVARILRCLTDSDARRIGAAARERVLAEHTYAARALQFEDAVEGIFAEGAAA
jgi:spore maturation protein CgeB